MTKSFMTKMIATAAALATIGIATVATAHHGWNSFDTSRAFYAVGTVINVRWGNPHSEVHLKVDSTALPADWTSRALPEGANEIDGRATIASARPYDGGHDEIELVLAGPEWMQRWDLNRPLEAGEKIEVVGYLGSSDKQALRPVMFWLANGQGVWQQLTSFPQRPEPVQQ
ncbi:MULTISPECIES: DUF6152 family protein [Agrobacterium]|uniref:DUF6152 family protein n=1 Tax=Agrobacterium TaxID=357 RepID=UPI000B1E75AF|nr:MULTISPECIES: DUF6152 family protein [Agrobacterium]